MITHEIATWFLVLSLFVPRIALLIAYCSNGIPPNNIPFMGDFFMTVFFPRLLVIIYIVTNMGFNAWALVHSIVAVAGLLGVVVSRSSNKN